MDEGTDNNADADKNGEAAKHENRDILGVARTGDLAKGLLLTGTIYYNQPATAPLEASRITFWGGGKSTIHF